MPLSVLISGLLFLSGCTAPLSLSKVEGNLVTSLKYEPDVALALKRITGNPVEAFNEAKAEREKTALSTALTKGQTDGERGAMLVDILNKSSAKSIALQSRLTAGTTGDTATQMRDTLQSTLPAGYQASLDSIDGNSVLVVRKL